MNRIQIGENWRKLIGFRNIQENLEKVLGICCLTIPV
jgi:hypothetical protein